MNFQYDDGGRKASGYTGNTGDCVTRAIAIATDKPYLEVYNALFDLSKEYALGHKDKVAIKIFKQGASPRDGVFKDVYKIYLESIGWKWTPTMFFGQGCKVHLTAQELPMGRLIVSVSKHLTAVIDGVLYDTYDCSRNDNRCVYGYYSK